MFQKDYIMRMIEQFTKVIAVIFGLKSEAEFEEKQQVLDEALHDFTGLSEFALESLSYKDLINLVSGFKEAKPEKCFILAELLKAKADVFSSLGDREKSFNLYLKSFNIYVDVMLSYHNSRLEPNYTTIDQTIEEIKPFRLPGETLKLLYRYYERIKKYDKAEDILFELLDLCSYNKDLLSEGIAFYKRLIEKTPEELEFGNLPMDEVLEGLKKLQDV